MHLVAGEMERIDDGGSAVDLDQSPGDIVILSAADTELAAFASAFAREPEGPSLRLANLMQLTHPYSVDLYLEKTIAQAKFVFVRMMGGVGYWPYGLEALRALSRAGGPEIAVVPGEDRWDAALEAYTTVAPEIAQKLWRYCAEGGAVNIGRALGYLRHVTGANEAPLEPQVLPEVGFYRPGEGVVTEALRPGDAGCPVALLTFYRSVIPGGSTEPVDALIEALDREGIASVAIFASSLKNEAAAAFIEQAFDDLKPAIVLNATAFAISRPGRAHEPTVLDRAGRPVLQIVFAGTGREAWLESSRGLGPRDLIMNVVLPEVDGRILTRAVSFKEEIESDGRTDSRIVVYRADRERIAFVAAQAARWIRLGAADPADRRIALILSNYPDRDGRLANGVGLDTPESAARIATAMKTGGYTLEGFPETGRALIDLLLAGPTNALAKRAAFKARPSPNPLPQAGEGFLPSPLPEGEVGPEGRVRGSGLSGEDATPHPPASPSTSPHGRGEGISLPLSDYRAFHDALAQSVRDSLSARWGEPEADPFFDEGAFRLAIHRFGNVVVGIQPARGYGIDPKSTYHDPDLVPPHHYLAFHAWLRKSFDVDAIVHVGKHGNLEWLPGKALGLSNACWPEVVLGPTPLIYPFIVNDPGEGAQAKRRASAVVVDHLMPALTRAEAHGAFAEIETLIDEYHLALGADPRRRDHLEREILDQAVRHGIDRDLGILRDGDQGSALRAIDAHLCEIKELQIRDGLHIFGSSPQDEHRLDTLIAIARIPRSGGRPEDGSLHRAIATDLGLESFDPLACDLAADWYDSRPEALLRAADAPWRTNGDTVERIEILAKQTVRAFLAPDGSPPPGPNTLSVLEWLAEQLAPSLDRCGLEEIASVLTALNGCFVPPGPSGAPSRGRPDVLPTGKNFYSVDTRAVPTAAAWRIGKAAAEALVLRYMQDEGEWPRSVAISAWGTANMRTGGDDIAQVLALIGAEPCWETGTGRVTGFRVLTLSELKRPRVDVTLRISGMFRDAFPEQIDLIDSAIRAVAAREEPADANPIAAAHGKGQDLARIFGAKPGAYGAGLQAMIDEKIWDSRADLGEAFLAWSSFAYGGGAEGEAAGDRLRARLVDTDAVLHNQDNREHDILDSDDYYQFQGGLSASIETLKGAAPRLYHGDHSRPETPVVRPLAEEIGRVVRGRAINPKWIAGCMRHGYKGAFEMAATLDYLFAFAATTHAVGDHHFDALYDAYIADEAVRDFIADANEPALTEMADRFLEAMDRGLWSPRANSAYERLAALASRRPARKEIA
ncbi:cobaltochelatase subunit CobN [Kaistia defluvii]|uniref:Cobaltochelatase subunit CobN n=1 Tax=Kaistia defluvii TaxID=410841 RepID=A0ABV2QUY4_9HYPH